MTAYRHVRTGRPAAQRDGVRWMVDPADLDQMPAAGRVRRARAGGGRRGPQCWPPAWLPVTRPAPGEVVEATLTSGGRELSDVYVDFLVPALRAIGDGWAAGLLDRGRELGIGRWRSCTACRTMALSRKGLGRPHQHSSPLPHTIQ